MREKLNLRNLLIVLGSVVLFALVIIFIRISNQPKAGEPFSTLPDLKTSLTDGNIDFKSKPVIDLSAYQPVDAIDYAKLSQNISGAIVRVQDGIKAVQSTTVNKDGSDPAFEYHITKLQAQGIPVAVYAYANATSLSNMKNEAKAFYNRAKAYKPTFWWIDIEAASMPDMNAGVEAFRAELESLGVKNIGLYSRDSFLTENKIDTSRFVGIWLAYYGLTDDGSFTATSSSLTFQLQQFTDKGQLPGYSGMLDLSRVKSQADYSKIFLNHQ